MPDTTTTVTAAHPSTVADTAATVAKLPHLPDPATTQGVTVHLPAGLSARTGGKRTFRVSGATLRDLVSALDLACPGVRFDLCQENGELRQFVNVFVAGRNVRHLQGLATPIPAGASVHILPSVAGG